VANRKKKVGLRVEKKERTSRSLKISGNRWIRASRGSEVEWTDADSARKGGYLTGNAVCQTTGSETLYRLYQLVRGNPDNGREPEKYASELKVGFCERNRTV